MQSENKTFHGRRAFRIAAGIILTVIVAGFVVYRFAGDWSRIAEEELRFEYWWLAAALGMVFVNNLVHAGGWYMVLRCMGRRVPARRALPVFFISQLSRNVPGSVWNYAGMAYLGKRIGIDRKDTLSAAMIVLLCGLVSSVIIFAVSPVFSIGDGVAALALLTVPVGLILLHPRIFFSILNAGLKLIKKQPVRVSLRYHHLLCVLLAEGATWLVSGWIFRCVLLSFFGTAPDVFTLAGIFAISWCVGFMVLPVPGGLGVREAMLALLLGQYGIEPAVAVAASLVTRLLQLIVESALAAAGGVLWRRHRLSGLQAGQMSNGPPEQGKGVSLIEEVPPCEIRKVPTVEKDTSNVVNRSV